MRIIIAFFLLFFSSHVQAAPLPTFEITLNNGVFTPAFIEVPAKQRIKIKIHNIGTAPAEFENLSLRVEKVLAPDVKSFVIVPPLKPGTYDFIDEFHLNGPGFKIIVK